MADCRLLLRSRLLELAGERWTRRVVTLVAGPGFGKSVLLAQMSGENRLAPRGAELVVSCAGSDGSPAAFLSRLADALDHAVGAASGGPALIGPGALLAELARRWPLGICVVVDDAHHVTATVEGARLLTQLVTEAPPPVHFVVASRRPVKGLAALRARGEVLDLGERELALSSAELHELAAAHGADPEAIARSGGWPAVACVSAAYGIDSAGEYVWEAVLEHLDERHRRVLAVAAAVGPCDRELLRAAVGSGNDDDFELLAELPLVTARDGELIAHDLWRRAVQASLDDDERRDAVARAAAVLARRGDYDRARRLCTSQELWLDAALVLRASCSHGHPEVGPNVLSAWLDALPPDRFEEPHGLLLRGLVARISDPFGPSTTALLERAAYELRAAGDVTGEITMINELAYVLRIQGRSAELPALVVRAAELQATGHPGADGLVAMARSVCAEMTGDVTGMLAPLDDVPLDALSRDWQALFAFRRMICLLTTGDEPSMLASAVRCTELAGEMTMRHAAALARWYAGDVGAAESSLDDIITDSQRSKVDGVALGAFATMVLASTGRVDEALDQLAFTEAAVGDGPLVPLMRGYLTGISALVAAARGDDAAARSVLEAALAEGPLTDPVGWLSATRWLPLAYVLVPSSRAVIEERSSGAVHVRRLAIARAVVAAASGGVLDPRSLDGVCPSAIVTAVPVSWAMVLAARLHADGVPAGVELATWLLSRFGGAARDALRLAADHPNVGTGARKLLAAVPVAPGSIRVDVLGPTRLHLEASTGPDWQRERVRSLLLYLVVNGPSSRESICDALWPDLDPAAADRNLRVTLSYLQRVLEPDRRRGEAPFLLRQDGTTVVLAGAPHLLVDAAEFEQLVARAEESDRRGAPSVARQQYRAALELWRGPCFADVAYEEWIQPARGRLCGRFVQAAVRAGELALAAGDTTAARRAAHQALAADEWSESAHRVLIAAALADGDHAGAARAAAACDALLTELGVAAGPATQMLIRRLRRPERDAA